MTYIRELEELDINVPDLMMGLVLRAENVSNNHYNGSIGRIGRSLSESRSNKEIEFRILTMISDAQLDDYNRTLAYYLFKNYNYYLTDKVAQRRNEKRLNEAMKTLPLYLSAKLDRK